MSQRMQDICSDIGYPLEVGREVMDSAVSEAFARAFLIETNWAVVDLIWKIEELQARVAELENGDVA